MPNVLMFDGNYHLKPSLATRGLQARMLISWIIVYDWFVCNSKGVGFVGYSLK
jgi:hypothetical protein